MTTKVVLIIFALSVVTNYAVTILVPHAYSEARK